MVGRFSQPVLGPSTSDDMRHPISIYIRAFVFPLKESTDNGVRVGVAFLAARSQYTLALSNSGLSNSGESGWLIPICSKSHLFRKNKVFHSHFASQNLGPFLNTVVLYLTEILRTEENSRNGVSRLSSLK